MVFLDYFLNLICTVLRYVYQATSSDPESLPIYYSLLHAQCCGEREIGISAAHLDPRNNIKTLWYKASTGPMMKC